MSESVPQHAIRTVDVCFAYDTREVLHDICVDIPLGKHTVFIGGNGSGKSTLLSLIAGVLEPDRGTIERHKSQQPAYAVQRSQANDQLPITVGQTVNMGRWAHLKPWQRLSAQDKTIVQSSLDRLSITDLVHRQLGELSGGQRQRALVAQGLSQQSWLLLLDEPTAGLDRPSGEMICHEIVAECQRGVTVIEATHDLEHARTADYCVLLAGGRIVATGDPQEVLTEDNFAQIFAGQIRPHRH